MTEHDPDRSLDETQPIPRPAGQPPPPTAPTPTEARAATGGPAAPIAGPAQPAPGGAPVTGSEGTPVQPVEVPGRRGGARWAIAGVAIVAIVGIAAAGAMLLTGRAAEPDAYAYLPADTAMVVEIRPDLPGDQREHLGSLLSKFPGFADQSTIEAKLDEAIDRFVDEAAGRDVNYATDIKPLIGGPVIVAATKVPDRAASSSDGYLILATSTTTQCGSPPFANVVETVAHAGKQLSIVETEGERIACFVDGRNVLAGGVEDVKRALDTKAGTTSLGTDPAFEAARAKLSGDTLGLVYVSKAGISSMVDLAESATIPGASPMDRGTLPDWVVFGLRAEAGGLLMDLAMPMPAGAAGASPTPSPPAAKVSTVATRLPAGTIFAMEVRSLGPTIDGVLDQVAALPDAAEAVEQIDAALGILGGRDAILGWMGDASLVVARDGSAFGGGLVLETPDESRASATFTQIRTLLAFAGQQGIEVSDETYGSGTITTLKIDSSTLGGAPAGGAVDLPDTIDLAYTVQQGLVVLGVGPDFVKSVVDTVPGQSLADQPRYQAALAIVGSTNGGQGYLDLAAGIDALEELALPLAGPDDRAEWEEDIAPYVEPLEAIAWSTTVDGGFLQIRFAFTAHEARQ